jgi:glycopeptide antibiotics resistance protein
MKNQASQPPQEWSRWSNRILIVSLIGIVYLTLFPFRFDFAFRHPLRTSPFLLGPSVKHGGHFDFALNVLLFIPFGSGLAAQMRKRGASRSAALVVALTAGAVTSYVVEFIQFYIPMRNSGWDDVLSNSTGSVAGFLLFELCGDTILKKLGKLEGALEGWLSPRRTAVVLLVYFGVCFGVSILLQQETHLSNWDAQCALYVGNDASGQRAWKGQVVRLQIWNRALPENLVHRVVARDPEVDTESGSLASYEFTTASPYLDERKFLPALTWMPGTPSFSNAQALEMDGRSWLGTKIPVADLTREIQKTNQFTVHIVCTPAEIQNADRRIFSISRSAENVNLHLRQEGTNLVLWFRNPLSERRSILAWYVPRVFEVGQMRDILASYDGADASIYVDGKKVPGGYHLGPGASLMHSFYFVHTADLGGYVVVYETLIFLPAGLLIGIAARRWAAQKATGRLLLAECLFLPPALLELLLVRVSGRSIWVENILLSLLLCIAGAILVNADRCVEDHSHTS